MRKPDLDSLQKLMALGLLLVPVVFLCDRYLDIPVALFVKNQLYANTRWTRLTSDLPDLLLMVVILSTSCATAVYLMRARAGIYDATTMFAKLIAFLAPAAFILKTLLKITFGRINTRFWLQEPDLYGFHWFQMRGEFRGFPSGHMFVIVTLVAAVWRFYPKTRPLCAIAVLSLCVALVLTDYHFVSDVIAGTYFGVLLEAVAVRLLIREPSPPRVANL